jgi:uncharacterized caspase-like protein
MVMSPRIFCFLALAGIAAGFIPQEAPRVQPEEPLKVQLAVNNPSLSYVENDTLRISITANKNCYLRLIYSDANGKDVIIFPNYQHRDDQVKGGVVHSVPTRFLVTPPFGKETLHAFVSSEKFSGFVGADRGDGLYVLNEPIKEVVRKLRAGSIFGEYAEQMLTILTAARSQSPPTQNILQEALPQIRFSKPGPSEFAVTQSDSVVIEGDVEGVDLLPTVSLNGLSLKASRVQSILRFRSKVALALGENRFEVTAANKKGRSATKVLIVKREEYKFAGQRWAVVFGISKYSNKDIPNLRYSHRDAEAFHDFLKSPNGGAFPDDHLLLLTNEKATKAGIENAIFNFLKPTRKEDLVMIFFSGHGLSRGKGYSYFVTHDTDPMRIEETAFNMEEIRRALRTSIRAERVMIFADACYSGAVNDYLKGTRSTMAEENLINRYLVEMGKVKPGIISITSCAENEVSTEAWLYWEHGIFTFVLVSGLGGKITDTDGKVKSFESADANQDGIVTVGELSAYVSKYVPGYTKNKQNPQISKSDFDPNTPLSVIR